MKEIRSTEIRAETQSADEGNSLVINGVPIVFDTPTVIRDSVGSYTEIIKRGALDEADLNDSRLLYNHDFNKIPLARTPKTMQFEITDKGLNIRAELPNTEEGRSIFEAVKRGDLSGMSFAFKVPKGGDTFDPKTNTRTIHKIEKVYEVSVVPFPCYEATTVSAEARSNQIEIRNKYKAIQNAKILCNKILMK